MSHCLKRWDPPCPPYPPDADIPTVTDDHPLVNESDDTFAHVQNLGLGPTLQRGHVSDYSITGVLTRFAPSLPAATCPPRSRGPH
ncbi:hypothetical protein L484_003383 [Morus notabilis]|uniref:Uncharacterized protein n=1 Tax=Morus notabilis TaxID=981085 RepID=W9SI27_9ROSA|nr:hypothetical protein L484_003383 [Morus notabilis]